MRSSGEALREDARWRRSDLSALMMRVACPMPQTPGRCATASNSTSRMTIFSRVLWMSRKVAPPSTVDAASSAAPPQSTIDALVLWR